MDKPKVLIANYNAAFCSQAVSYLQDLAQVSCCHSGTQVLAMLPSLQPDILLLDLMLPELDGLAVLHRITNVTPLPKILITTALRSEYVLHRLTQFPVSYILPSPVELSSLAFHVGNLLQTNGEPLSLPQDNPADMQTAFSSILIRLGMRAKWNGFDYLVAGMPLYLQDPRQSVTKELYDAIGKRFGKNAQAVEHAIRTAIKSAYDSGNRDVWCQYFPPDASGEFHRPSNKVFFAQIAQIFLASHSKKAV